MIWVVVILLISVTVWFITNANALITSHVSLFPLSRVNAASSLMTCFFVGTKAIAFSDKVGAVLFVQVVLLNSISTCQWLNRVQFI